jgi:very-short-patch-repair endonuclease
LRVYSEFLYNKRALDIYPQRCEFPRGTCLWMSDDRRVWPDLVVATEAIASGDLTRRDLMRSYRKIHRNVYGRKGLAFTALDRAHAAWLWSGRKATLVGTSAAALHGTRYLPDDAPAEIAHARYAAPPGIRIYRGAIAPDEICLRRSIDCTTPARTAYDIGRRVTGDTAIIRIDALLNATGCTVAAVEQIADRYPGARGICQLRVALDLVDGGAESPRETELRLLLVRSGVPRPVTQIKVGRRRIDMGWPEFKVGVEYDGAQHWTNPDDHADDIERLEFLAANGWLIVRVSGRPLRRQRDVVVRRVCDALARRGCVV